MHRDGRQADNKLALIFFVWRNQSTNNYVTFYSVVGAVTVILGLYTVLWGKAKDIGGMNAEKHLSTQNFDSKTVSVIIDDDSVDKTRCKTDLEEPLLLDKATKVDSTYV